MSVCVQVAREWWGDGGGCVAFQTGGARVSVAFSNVCVCVYVQSTRCLLTHIECECRRRTASVMCAHNAAGGAGAADAGPVKPERVHTLLLNGVCALRSENCLQRKYYIIGHRAHANAAQPVVRRGGGWGVEI